MSVYRKYTRYGRVTVGQDRYALLRPFPFETEYSLPNTTAFYVADWDGFIARNPHVLYASNGGWHVDLDDPEDIEVAVKEAVSKEPVRFPVLQELD